MTKVFVTSCDHGGRPCYSVMDAELYKGRAGENKFWAQRVKMRVLGPTEASLSLDTLIAAEVK